VRFKQVTHWAPQTAKFHDERPCLWNRHERSSPDLNLSANLPSTYRCTSMLRRACSGLALDPVVRGSPRHNPFPNRDSHDRRTIRGDLHRADVTFLNRCLEIANAEATAKKPSDSSRRCRKGGGEWGHLASSAEMKGHATPNADPRHLAFSQTSYRPRCAPVWPRFRLSPPTVVLICIERIHLTGRRENCLP